MGKEIAVQVEDGKILAMIMQLRDVENSINLTDIDLLKFRFKQGCILSIALNSKDRNKYGEKTIEKICRDVGFSRVYMYRIHHLAAYFNYETRLLERDIKTRFPNERKISWYLKNFADPKDDPAILGGKDNQKEYLLDTAEKSIAKGSEALQQASEDYPSEETTGVAYASYEVLEDFNLIRDPSDKFPIRQEDRIVDEEYLEFQRTKPCAITGAYPAEAHHWYAKGRSGNNASDYMTLPIHRDVHDWWHKHPNLEEFEEKYSKLTGKKIDVRTLIIEHIADYIKHLKGMVKF